MPKDARARAEPGANREGELLSIIDEMRPALEVVQGAQAMLRKAKKDYGVIRDRASQAGYTLHVLDKALKAMNEPTNRKGQQNMADEEYFVFKTLGLPTASVQGELNFGSQEERDEIWWGDQGYAAGIRGDEAIPPSECPPHFHQKWLGRRADGVEYSSWAKSEHGKIVDRDRSRPSAATPAGDPETADQDPLLA